MQEFKITTRDNKELFVQYFYKGHKETVIYLHGGPAQGCWDFKYTAEKLSLFVNVISFDQRGVCRSARINNADDFTSEMLIDDIEDVRQNLSIEKLTLIGCSYGGQLILRYAEKYPNHVNKLVYVCPSFNFLFSMRNVYKKSIEILKCQNRLEEIKLLKELLNDDDVAKYVVNIATIPDDVRKEVYYVDWTEEADESITNNNITEEQKTNGTEHQKRVFEENTIYNDYLPILTKIEASSLLVVGDHDPICCKIQQDEFLRNSKNGILKIVPNAGHLLYLSNVEEFVGLVRSFLIDCHE